MFTFYIVRCSCIYCILFCIFIAHIQLYLYPFLNTSSKQRPFEYLRLTSLGVIGALVKVDDPEVVNFLLQTEIFPMCLRVMGAGTELSKTVATFIVQKILLDDAGLNYVCSTSERFYMVCTRTVHSIAITICMTFYCHYFMPFSNIYICSSPQCWHR